MKMSDELLELLDTAIYKEIAAQAFYIAGQERTNDTGAQTLMQELAEEELHHQKWLTGLKDKGTEKLHWNKEKVSNLMISEYLVGGDSLADASLQDTLIFAIKREQQAVEFYSRMISAIHNQNAKHLCEQLVHQELRHKLKLEIFYDDMYYRED